MNRLLATALLIALPLDAAAVKQDEEQRLEACRSKLKTAQRLDVLYDLAWERGSGPRVLVGPTYHRMPLDAKEGFAETLNCFLTAGKAKACMNFDLRDYRSGVVVHTFRNCRLKTP